MQEDLLYMEDAERVDAFLARHPHSHLDFRGEGVEGLSRPLVWSYMGRTVHTKALDMPEVADALLRHGALFEGATLLRIVCYIRSDGDVLLGELEHLWTPGLRTMSRAAALAALEATNVARARAIRSRAFAAALRKWVGECARCSIDTRKFEVTRCATHSPRPVRRGGRRLRLFEMVPPSCLVRITEYI
jgi:hypothetical protein